LHKTRITSLNLRTLEIVFVAATVALFLLFTLPNLANFPVPSDDEIWILSASHKLATQGVFGTDLFKDYYRADEVYLFNMPGHHFVLAAVYKIVGTGILAGRLVSIVYGLLTIGLVYLFARRVYGLPTAVLSLVLLIFLRLNIGFDTGLPLQEMSRTMRYDIAPVPFMLGGALLLLNPTPWRVAAAGAVFGVATLLQFYGAFMLPVAAVYLLMEAAPLRERLKLIGLVALTAIVVTLPYGVFILANYDEFEGQTSTLYRRGDVTDFEFYRESLDREDSRFAFKFGTLEESIENQPSGKLALLVGLPATILFLGLRMISQRGRGDRLIVLSLICVPLGLALFEYQKISGYWIAAFPFLCIGLAVVCVTAITAAWGILRRHVRGNVAGDWLRVACGGAAAIFLAVVIVEGASAQRNGFETFDNATEYLSLRETLSEYVPPDSTVVGATSLWWAMPETEFRSYYMLFYRTNPRTTERFTTIDGYLDEVGTDYVVLNRISRFFLQRLLPRDSQALAQYLETRGEQIAYIEDRSYGWIEVWKISP
jgi:4-amino-4-deoxy-L-arabinose transferase-like glycosyltransferase